MRIEGTNQEVEGGEWVINRKKSERHNSLLEAINNGQFDLDPFSCLQRYQMRPAAPLSETVGTASSKTVNELVSGIRENQGVTRYQFDTLTSEVVRMREEQNSRLDRLHDKTDIVIGNKHIKKQDGQTTITDYGSLTK